jgi:hypothetical protein
VVLKGADVVLMVVLKGADGGADVSTHCMRLMEALLTKVPIQARSERCSHKHDLLTKVLNQNLIHARSESDQ